jgi:hypothetical protein
MAGLFFLPSRDRHFIADENSMSEAHLQTVNEAIVAKIEPEPRYARLRELAEEAFRQKALRRKELAALPIEEKLRILVEMQKRANEVRRATGRPEMFVWQLN